MPVGVSLRSVDDLRANLAQARQAAQSVSASCLLAADELEATGTPPSDDLLAQCERLSDQLTALAGAIQSEVAGQGLQTFEAALPADFVTLEQALCDLDEGARRRAETLRLVERALAVTSAVEGLRHADDAQFAPLRSAQEQAAGAAARLRGWTGVDAPAEAEQLCEESHPLLALAMLAANPDGLDDARWGALQDAVTAAFGRTMAAAVARGRIGMDEPARRSLLAVCDSDGT